MYFVNFEEHALLFCYQLSHSMLHCICYFTCTDAQGIHFKQKIDHLVLFEVFVLFLCKMLIFNHFGKRWLQHNKKMQSTNTELI